MEQETLPKIYNQKFYNALNRIEQKIPPIWLMRQAGRYHKHYQNLKKKHTFEELCKTPELICETTMGPIKDFDFDAAILFSDILFPSFSALQDNHRQIIKIYFEFFTKAFQPIFYFNPCDKSWYGVNKQLFNL